MRYAVGIPNLREYADPRTIAELGRDAEAAGWDGVFVWDHLAARERERPATDPWIALAAIAATTERVRLGAMITPLARRRPWKVARETVALDLLSDGRVVVGVGLGAAADTEFAAFGDPADPKERAAVLDEGLEILTGLWSGEPFSFVGEHHRVDAQFLPAPLQRPRIPVWVAGKWPAKPPFRRAARWDGVFPTHAEITDGDTMSAAQLREIVDYTLAYREASGEFDVVVEGTTSGRDPAGDAAKVSALGEAGLTWWIEQVGWFRGSIEDSRTRVRSGPPTA